MKRTSLILSFVLVPALVLGVAACASAPDPAPQTVEKTRRAPVADSKELPVAGAPTVGSERPLVSISLFVDPARPDFEALVDEHLQTVGAHQNELRLVLHLASDASRPGIQGWKLLHYHWAAGTIRDGIDFLTDWQATWRDGDPIALAIANGAVDAESIRVYFQSEDVQESIATQQAFGANRGHTHGTVLVNGSTAGGDLRSTIAAQTAAAQAMVAEGTPREELYGKLVSASNVHALPPGFVDSRIIPIKGSYTWGGVDAPVTVVAFMNLQCPFSARSWKVLKELDADYENEIRIVFKHFPLPFHKEAAPAAYAAEAARKQGKFIPFVDGIYLRQRRLKDDFDGVIAELVRELQLDAAAFERDREAAAAKERVKQDKATGTQVDVRGTPAFRINGEAVVGAQPKSKFVTVIDAEKKAVTDAVKAGRFDLDNAYARRVQTHVEAAKEAASRPTAKPKRAAVHWVPVRPDDHVIGPSDAPVTIVVFNDLQCPFCKRADQTIDKLLKAYPKDVRYVIRHKPLPFHAEAHAMARATIAADKQGKFKQMHDLLFDKQRAIRGRSREVIEAAAKKLGLNMKAFWADFDASTTHDRVDGDIKFAESIGIRGTPGFIINGRRVVGAKPYAEFEKIVQEETARAKKLRAKGVKPADLYRELTDQNLANPPSH